MASKYVVEENSMGKCDVLFSQMSPKAELEARYRELIGNGWSHEEADREVAQIALSYKKCNSNEEGYAPATCLEFVASYVEFGDVLVDRGQVYIVNRAVTE